MTNTNNTFMSPTIDDVLAPSYANFQPGVFDPNKVPVIGQRSVTYSPDRLNPAPNFGIAWSPSAQQGLLGRILGNNKTVIRASYGISFFDEGLNGYYWINTNAGNWRSVSAGSGSEYAPGTLTLQSQDPPFLWRRRLLLLPSPSTSSRFRVTTSAPRPARETGRVNSRPCGILMCRAGV